ncbi:hypothetical protein NDU88_004599 [Pleurodeles waltl]|uniref:Uncharacterized protein n=1 Tax=Pleurodeles waltl TaxID=8319 RepID=A0AAV7MC55_PLEWA|nr:hypothetical protein NDU88_004599 [Pleurodeles waltl]
MDRAKNAQGAPPRTTQKQKALETRKSGFSTKQKTDDGREAQLLSCRLQNINIGKMLGADRKRDRRVILANHEWD